MTFLQPHLWVLWCKKPMASGCAYFLPTWSDQVGSRELLGSQFDRWPVLSCEFVAIWGSWKVQGKDEAKNHEDDVIYSYIYIYIDLYIIRIYIYCYIVDIFLIKQSNYILSLYIGQVKFCEIWDTVVCIPKGSLLMAVSGCILTADIL